MERKKKILIRDTTVYIVLRFLVVSLAVLQFLQGNYENVFSCILVLILFLIPSIIDKKFNIDLPDMLESIIYIFIFSANILGEMQNFYGLIPHWDTILHTINGFIFAGVGFSLVELLNKNDKIQVSLSPIYVAVVALCFSITIGTVWEFFEYGMDQTGLDMQKDVLISDLETVYFNNRNEVEIISDIDKTTIEYADGEIIVIDNGYLDIGLEDTMDDMIVNAVGALVFSVIGYLYIKDKEQYKFATNFIPKKKKI